MALPPADIPPSPPHPVFPLRTNPTIHARSEPLKAHLLQLQILSNHQNGRDTHIRQVQVFGPRADVSSRVLDVPLALASPEACAYATVR